MAILVDIMMVVVMVEEEVIVVMRRRREERGAESGFVCSLKSLLPDLAKAMGLRQY